MMLIAPFLVLGIAHAKAPAFQLNFEKEAVILRSDLQPQVLGRVWERMEFDPHRGAWRVIVLQDGEKTIQTFVGKTYSSEKIHPDGSKESSSGNLTSAKSPIMVFQDQVKETGLKVLTSKDLKEFRTILGIRCHKHVDTIEVNGGNAEQVVWVPVDPVIADRVDDLERYFYAIDGEDRTLTFAEVTTSLKFGKTPVSMKKLVSKWGKG